MMSSYNKNEARGKSSRSSSKTRPLPPVPEYIDMRVRWENRDRLMRYGKEDDSYDAILSTRCYGRQEKEKQHHDNR